MNDFEGKEVDNLLLLDKIRDFEGVLNYLIKIQRKEIESKTPDYFSQVLEGSNDPREAYMKHLNETKLKLMRVTSE